jgi:nucleoid-associated protein YejK|tara:strand:+ start:2020 stop:2274 length:255 start_codon:yes stop_codon:yes gene_type:complete
MNSILTGHYWKVSENVFNIQVTCESSDEKVVSDFFSNWTNAGEGIDHERHKKILIFTKTFTNEAEFNKIIRTINKNTIILEEAV